MRKYRDLSDTQISNKIKNIRARRLSKIQKIQSLRNKYDMSRARNKPRLWKWKRRAEVDRKHIARLVAEQVRRWRRNQFVQYPNTTHYSKNFTRAELNCKGPECQGKNPSEQIQANLARLCKTGLEPLRLKRIKRGEKGVGVLSGHRCKIHNDRVGGATNSKHLTGEAADLIPTNGQRSWVVDLLSIKAFFNGGIGSYVNGGVHGDVRKGIARWIWRY